MVLTSVSALAQQKLTLEEIWGGAFRTQGMTALEALKNTNQYTVLNFDRATKSSQIDLYDFATLEKVATLIDSKNHKELEGIDSYTFSKDAKKDFNRQTIPMSIFRHSFTADYFIYDVTAKSLVKLADYKVQEPTFSPDGTKSPTLIKIIYMCMT